MVKAISGVQTVRFKNELERNITIKLGYANAKIYECDCEVCPPLSCSGNSVLMHPLRSNASCLQHCPVCLFERI